MVGLIASHDMSSLPVIDSESIENLRSLNPGDGDEFLREIITIYLEDTPQRIAELEESLAGGDTPQSREAGSFAVALAAAAQGVQILRVHDVAGTRQALSVWRASTEGKGA